MNSAYRKIANSLEPLRARLRRRFSPSRQLRRSDGLRLVREGGSGQEWILARELCAYTVVDAAGVPAARRRAFADTAVRRWTPFNDPGFHVEWAGDKAMVWGWSTARVLDGIEAEPPRRLLPESLYRGGPEVDGQALLAMDHGVEGRIWRDHVLVASGWWPRVPDLAEWNQFRRGAGMGTVATIPEVLETPLAAAPWSATPRVALGDLASRHRKLLAAGGTGLLVAILSAMLVSALSIVVSIGLVEGEIQDQDETLQRILLAREQAIRDAGEIDALLRLRPPASQIELLAELLRLVPGTGWQLLEWRMPDASTLQVVVRMQQPDPSALVQAWEASPYLEAVTVELGRDPQEISIKAHIVRPPLAAAGPAAATAAAAPVAAPAGAR